MKKFLKWFAVVLCSMGLIAYTVSFFQAKDNSEKILFVAGDLLMILFLFLLTRKKKSENNPHANTTEISANISDSHQKGNKKELNETTLKDVMRHVNGLPIAENIACEIVSTPEYMEFKAGNVSIKLNREKIVDVCVKTDIEIQDHMVSSVGGAVGGAVLFGPLGAIIGGRAKKKQTKHTTRYLIITYMDDSNELKYIGFDTTYNSPFNVSKFVKQFQLLNQAKVQIEL